MCVRQREGEGDGDGDGLMHLCRYMATDGELSREDAVCVLQAILEDMDARSLHSPSPWLTPLLDGVMGGGGGGGGRRAVMVAAEKTSDEKTPDNVPSGNTGDETDATRDGDAGDDGDDGDGDGDGVRETTTPSGSVGVEEAKEGEEGLQDIKIGGGGSMDLDVVGSPFSLVVGKLRSVLSQMPFVYRHIDGRVLSRLARKLPRVVCPSPQSVGDALYVLRVCHHRVSASLLLDVMMSLCEEIPPMDDDVKHATLSMLSEMSASCRTGYVDVTDVDQDLAWSLVLRLDARNRNATTLKPTSLVPLVGGDGDGDGDGGDIPHPQKKNKKKYGGMDEVLHRAVVACTTRLLAILPPSLIVPMCVKALASQSAFLVSLSANVLQLLPPSADLSVVVQDVDVLVSLNPTYSVCECV